MSRGKECSEACLELLSMELVRMYTAKEGGAPASSALEAIGVRVGRQLVERCLPKISSRSASPGAPISIFSSYGKFYGCGSG